MANTEFIYEKYILELMDKVTEKYVFPQKKHYDFEVAKLRTQRECKNGGEYTADQVHSTVSRTLDRLSKGSSGKMIRYKNYFLPNTDKYLFQKLSEEYFYKLVNQISITKKDICFISYNTCAFFADKNDDSGKEANEVIADCLGEELYAVWSEGDFHYIMIKSAGTKSYVANQDSREFLILKAFEDAVERVYEYQSKILKKRKASS